jgi:hypothetical protein
MKRIICCTLLLLSFKIAWPQKVMSDKSIAAIYQAANNASDNGFYLAKFKRPETISNLYNFYIITSPSPVHTNENLISACSANALWKATGSLVKLYQKSPNKIQDIDLVVIPGDKSVTDTIKKYTIKTLPNGNTVRVTMLLKNLPKLLQQQNVSFAFEVRKPHEELVINDIDLGVNSIAAIENTFTDINGTGINVGIKENRYDDDLDLLSRSFKSFQTADVTSSHATIMATLIGGNGNSFIKGLGAAPKVKFTSSTFARLLPDSTAIFKAFNISVQNHSYGTGIENYYGIEAAAYDKQVFENDSIVHVFSSGNIGTAAPEFGLYSGLKGTANLSGTFKQAKNVLVVGGTDRINHPQDLSSAGPSYDGRVKPELVADGEDGTSGAAALVSGTVALLQQAYKKQYSHLPSAALIKSVLINSADDIGQIGVDFKTGYGKLNALEALRTINENRFVKGSVAAKQQVDFTINVPVGCKQLKITVAWNDLPAAINAPSALVNDLDLSVTIPTGESVLPLTLVSYPSLDLLTKAGRMQKDTLNNTEQIILQAPIAGNYFVHVSGNKSVQNQQAFYVAYQTVIADKFEWTYPSGQDQLFAGNDNYLRWQNSFAIAAGKISVSYDHGSTWQTVSDVNLKNNYYVWTAPDVFTTAMLKMDINGRTEISKEFSLSKPINLNVGYNCTNGTLLHWKPQLKSKGYTIYTIKDNILQKLASTTDTSIIIPIQQQSSSYFAVCATGNGFESIKSYTINVGNQGVGCYVKTLLANIAASTIMLDLQLGSTYNLKTITWEKMTGPDQYTALNSIPASSGLSYHFTDGNPKKGTQYYRVKLITNDDRELYSDIASATFLQGRQFVIYPNPVSIQLNVLSGDIQNYELKLYDVSGKLSMVKSINNLQNIIPISLNPGVYVVAIELMGKVVYKGKLVKL